MVLLRIASFQCSILTMLSGDGGLQKKHQIKVESLSRLMVYILGHRPDEFGLVPDSDGYVSYKELLWAIHEEPGWKYVRLGHINEVLLSKDRALFETAGDRIKVPERRWLLDVENPHPDPPKVLYTPIRRKAHAHVMEKGLKGDEFLALSSDQDTAMRIGRRKDQKPVLLEITTEPAMEQGVLFYPFGDLFLAAEIPARFIVGPPVSQELREARESAQKKVKVMAKPADFTPGTFVMQIDRDPDLSRKAQGKKRRGWKEEARKERRRRNR
jgi:putative RNA 2'-phosphotransferase